MLCHDESDVQKLFNKLIRNSANWRFSSLGTWTLNFKNFHMNLLDEKKKNPFEFVRLTFRIKFPLLFFFIFKTFWGGKKFFQHVKNEFRCSNKKSFAIFHKIREVLHTHLWRGVLVTSEEKKKWKTKIMRNKKKNRDHKFLELQKFFFRSK